MPRRPVETFLCPNCGADVRAGAAACPECGADDETGWSDQTEYDGLDLPDDVEEAADEKISGLWKAVAIAVLAGVILLVLSGAW